jgi:hypothetical protein
MAHTLSGLLLQGSRAVPVNPWNIGCHAHFALVHTGIEQRRVSCRGVLILGCQKPTAQQASNRIGWCSRLLKMTPLRRSQVSVGGSPYEHWLVGGKMIELDEILAGLDFG